MRRLMATPTANDRGSKRDVKRTWVALDRPPNGVLRYMAAHNREIDGTGAEQAAGFPPAREGRPTDRRKRQTLQQAA